MIEINLLGDEKSKKKSRTASSISIGPTFKTLGKFINIHMFLSAAMVIGISAYFKNLIQTRREDYQNQLAQTSKQLSELQSKKRQLSQDSEQIQRIETEIATLRGKMNSIENIFSSRVFPVPKLDAISQTIPRFVWLTKLDYAIEGPKGKVTLEGAAITNDALSDFLAALQEYPGFSNIELSESIHQDEKDYAYKKFRIQLRTEEKM